MSETNFSSVPQLTEEAIQKEITSKQLYLNQAKARLVKTQPKGKKAAAAKKPSAAALKKEKAKEKEEKEKEKEKSQFAKDSKVIDVESTDASTEVDEADEDVFVDPFFLFISHPDYFPTV